MLLVRRARRWETEEMVLCDTNIVDMDIGDWYYSKKYMFKIYKVE